MRYFLVVWFICCPIGDKHEVKIREIWQSFPPLENMIFCPKHKIALLANRISVYKIWEEYEPTDGGISAKIIKKAAVYYGPDHWEEIPYVDADSWLHSPEGGER